MAGKKIIELPVLTSPATADKLVIVDVSDSNKTKQITVQDLNTIVGGTAGTTGTIPISQGGTGATTAAAARTNLGLGTASLADTIDFAVSAHNHAASSINSGTLDIARIPTGTNASTVCIGNDSRLSDARTPVAHNHTASSIVDFDTAVRTNRLDQMASPTIAVNVNAQRVVNLANPTATTDAVNKSYVDNAISAVSAGGVNDATSSTKGIIQLAGDLSGTASSPTLSTTGVSAGTYKSVSVDAKGRVTAATNPTTLAAYGITDAASLTTRLDQFASPITSLSLNNQRISNLLDPTSAQEAATKGYVDAVATGLDLKGSVRVASTANVNLSSAPSTIDAVTLVANNRILLKNQTTASENGIYIFSSVGSGLVRTTDADTSSEVTAGMYTYVEEGAVNGGKAYVLSTTGTITLGTTNLTFSLFNAGGGEVNTASNVGTVGIGVFKQKNGLNLEFKNLTVASNELAITEDTVNNNISLGINAANISITNLNGILSIAKGGTALTSYALGDILFSDATNSLGKLAGNTTTTKRFLSQTGTGSVSAAPSWATIVAADLPNTIPYTNQTNTFTRAQYSQFVALTDASTISVDASLSNVFTVTLAGNRTLGNPTNLGQGTYIFIITQDGTGSRTLAYGGNYKFPGGTVPTLTTTANAVDILSCISTGGVLHCNLVKDSK